jgi:SAM-dependent methyltransferase
MDVGCGAGPLTKALIDAGFDVTGIDTSAEMLELARANAPTATFVHASAYEVEFRAYDAVVALGEPLTYHAEGADADRLINHFFECIAEALPTGGMLIFDVIGLGKPSLDGRTWRSGDDWAVLVDTSENQAERTLVRDIETFRRAGELYKRSGEIHRVRLFDVPGLCHQLASCGFATETAQSYGDLPLSPRRCAFFATRRAEALGTECDAGSQGASGITQLATSFGKIAANVLPRLTTAASLYNLPQPFRRIFA